MSTKLKALTLAIGAMAAVGAFAAGPASARFESEATQTTLTTSANNTQVFQYQAEGIKLTCTTVTSTGTFNGTATTEATFVPEKYGGCSTILGPAHVHDNGCVFLRTVALGSTAATTHLTCSGTNKVEYTITDNSGNRLCTVKTGSQTPGGTSTGSNTGSGTTREVVITSAMTGITATREGSALCGPASSTTGTYSGSITYTGENPLTKAHVGIFMD
jgi:hypothetical protein